MSERITDERLRELATWEPGAKTSALSAQRAEWIAMARELAELREQVRWRPIESAPTDGTKMLLRWRTVPYPLSGRYVVDDEWAFRPKDWLAPEEGWRNDGDQCIPRNQSDCTHWMPLPEIGPLPGGEG